MVAVFSASRNSVVASRIEGKEENSRGWRRYMTVRRMIAARVMLADSSTSSNEVGSGLSRTKTSSVAPIGRIMPRLASSSLIILD